MESIATVGVGLAKSVFQIRAVDAEGRVVIASAVRRRDPVAFMSKLPFCLIGRME